LALLEKFITGKERKEVYLTDLAIWQLLVIGVGLPYHIRFSL